MKFVNGVNILMVESKHTHKVNKLVKLSSNVMGAMKEINSG